MFEEKVAIIKEHFVSCQNAHEVYEVIIALGRKSKPLESAQKTEQALVAGCQSRMYLHTSLRKGHLFFEAESDALIANGIAVLLTSVYNDETPEAVLKNPPIYLEELGIPTSLSPSRANGLASLYLRMKQEAVQVLVALSANPLS